MANWQRGKHSPRDIKTFKAGATVKGRRIVKNGADNERAVQSAAAADAHLGVSLIGTGIDPETSIADVDQNFDVAMDGECEVKYGGPVTRGDWLTSDADGRAVVAAPAAGTNVNVIGIALMSGVLDDIGSVKIQPTRIQG